ncbi:GNAT family N-acetyltransferase [Streptantibioticus rubrisoli]|uniref:GNAT family N-acetyltransferase n=1 Tax=Streptantibioticus rubrisoli TaxID=1387313 RepID=A0ABT1P5E1_9ACTN|nr:GNAT family protein [Streptantibioticus rubrisoli]MCQ4040562.1 GNAT family N-acetyltransferase [Streptantibioticus rubrisoli]
MVVDVSHEGPRLVLRQGRVALHEVTPEEAALVADGAPDGLRWIDGAPGEGTVVAARMVAKASAAGQHRPHWGLFAILRAEDAVAVGGMGFHGPPVDGVVEVGYDLSVSGRGSGWATDALRLLTDWTLRQPGVHTVLAMTEPDNRPSQRVLERAGFHRVEDREGLWAYELGEPGTPGLTR